MPICLPLRWVLCAAVPACAGAATPIPTTASFQVNATVTAGCLVAGNPSQSSGVGFGTLDFGTHPTLSATTATATLSAGSGTMAQLQCTAGATVNVTLNAGQNALGGQRRLGSSSGGFIPYTLYTTPAKTTAYVPGVQVPVDTSTGTVSLPVYGVAQSPGQGLPSGYYTDTVQVTFSW